MPPAGSKSGYFDSASHKRFATSPFSFIPSVVAMFQALAMTLPYFEVHSTERGPTSPLRRMPRGKTQISGSISSFQSMERAVSTVLPGPSYTTLVHAAASGSPAAHAMTAAAHPAMNFLRPFIYAYAKHTPCHKPRRDGRDPEIGVPAPCNGAARDVGRRFSMQNCGKRTVFRVRFVSLR